MAYTYSSYVTQLANLMTQDATAADFVVILPSIIDYAEQRIYRELDLLSTVTRDSSGALVSGNRNFTFPQHFVTCQQINLITPVGGAPETSSRNPLTVSTKEWLDQVWSSSSGSALPKTFAMLTDQSILLGPWPDQNYAVEVVGTIRPVPLSASNPNTFLTDYLPDLFMAASMVFGSGWKQNFGQQSDNPQMSESWESQYKALSGSAGVEEARKRWASTGWTSQSPQPAATPPRA